MVDTNDMEKKKLVPLAQAARVERDK